MAAVVTETSRNTDVIKTGVSTSITSMGDELLGQILGLCENKSNAQRTEDAIKIALKRLIHDVEKKRLTPARLSCLHAALFDWWRTNRQSMTSLVLKSSSHSSTSIAANEAVLHLLRNLRLLLSLMGQHGITKESASNRGYITTSTLSLLETYTEVDIERVIEVLQNTKRYMKETIKANRGCGDKTKVTENILDSVLDTMIEYSRRRTTLTSTETNKTTNQETMQNEKVQEATKNYANQKEQIGNRCNRREITEESAGEKLEKRIVDITETRKEEHELDHYNKTSYDASVEAANTRETSKKTRRSLKADQSSDEETSKEKLETVGEIRNASRERARMKKRRDQRNRSKSRTLDKSGRRNSGIPPCEWEKKCPHKSRSSSCEVGDVVAMALINAMKKHTNIETSEAKKEYLCDMTTLAVDSLTEKFKQDELPESKGMDIVKTVLVRILKDAFVKRIPLETMYAIVDTCAPDIAPLFYRHAKDDGSSVSVDTHDESWSTDSVVSRAVAVTIREIIKDIKLGVQNLMKVSSIYAAIRAAEANTSSNNTNDSWSTDREGRRRSRGRTRTKKQQKVSLRSDIKNDEPLQERTTSREAVQSDRLDRFSLQKDDGETQLKRKKSTKSNVALVMSQEQCAKELIRSLESILQTKKQKSSESTEKGKHAEIETSTLGEKEWRASQETLYEIDGDETANLEVVNRLRRLSGRLSDAIMHMNKNEERNDEAQFTVEQIPIGSIESILERNKHKSRQRKEIDTHATIKASTSGENARRATDVTVYGIDSDERANREVVSRLRRLSGRLSDTIMHMNENEEHNDEAQFSAEQSPIGSSESILEQNKHKSSQSKIDTHATIKASTSGDSARRATEVTVYGIDSDERANQEVVSRLRRLSGRLSDAIMHMNENEEHNDEAQFTAEQSSIGSILEQKTSEEKLHGASQETVYGIDSNERATIEVVSRLRRLSGRMSDAVMYMDEYKKSNGDEARFTVERSSIGSLLDIFQQTRVASKDKHSDELICGIDADSISEMEQMLIRSLENLNVLTAMNASQQESENDMKASDYKRAEVDTLLKSVEGIFQKTTDGTEAFGIDRQIESGEKEDSIDKENVELIRSIIELTGRVSQSMGVETSDMIKEDTTRGSLVKTSDELNLGKKDSEQSKMSERTKVSIRDPDEEFQQKLVKSLEMLLKETETSIKSGGQQISSSASEEIRAHPAVQIKISAANRDSISKSEKSLHRDENKSMFSDISSISENIIRNLSESAGKGIEDNITVTYRQLFQIVREVISQIDDRNGTMSPIPDGTETTNSPEREAKNPVSNKSKTGLSSESDGQASIESMGRKVRKYRASSHKRGSLNESCRKSNYKRRSIISQESTQSLKNPDKVPLRRHSSPGSALSQKSFNEIEGLEMIATLTLGQAIKKAQRGSMGPSELTNIIHDIKRRLGEQTESMEEIRVEKEVQVDTQADNQLTTLQNFQENMDFCTNQMRIEAATCANQLKENAEMCTMQLRDATTMCTDQLKKEICEITKQVRHEITSKKKYGDILEVIGLNGDHRSASESPVAGSNIILTPTDSLVRRHTSPNFPGKLMARAPTHTPTEDIVNTIENPQLMNLKTKRSPYRSGKTKDSSDSSFCDDNISVKSDGIVDTKGKLRKYIPEQGMPRTPRFGQHSYSLSDKETIRKNVLKKRESFGRPIVNIKSCSEQNSIEFPVGPPKRRKFSAPISEEMKATLKKMKNMEIGRDATFAASSMSDDLNENENASNASAYTPIEIVAEYVETESLSNGSDVHNGISEFVDENAKQNQNTSDDKGAVQAETNSRNETVVTYAAESKREVDNHDKPTVEVGDTEMNTTIEDEPQMTTDEHVLVHIHESAVDDWLANNGDTSQSVSVEISAPGDNDERVVTASVVGYDRFDNGISPTPDGSPIPDALPNPDSSPNPGSSRNPDSKVKLKRRIKNATDEQKATVVADLMSVAGILPTKKADTVKRKSYLRQAMSVMIPTTYLQPKIATTRTGNKPVQNKIKSKQTKVKSDGAKHDDRFTTSSTATTSKRVTACSSKHSNLNESKDTVRSSKSKYSLS